MLPREIETPDGNTIMVAGDMPYVMLAGSYDEDQYWLSLGTVFVFRKTPPPISFYTKTHAESLGPMRNRVAKPYARNPHTVGGKPPPDGNQTEMAFPGANRISHRQWEVIKANNYHGWERLKGKLVTVERKSGEHIIKWLEEECTGFFYPAPYGPIHFYNAVDAVTFKLRWG